MMCESWASGLVSVTLSPSNSRKSGSTVNCILNYLGERRPELISRLTCASSSLQTSQLAGKYGLKLVSPDELESFDLYVDGADQIDPEGNLIKGWGGALVREKLMAKMAKKFIVVADCSKYVPALGSCRIPIEIVPFATKSTISRIASLFEPSTAIEFRKSQPNSELFLSDNGNPIVDVYVKKPIKDIHHLAVEIKLITGVVDHGIFVAMDPLCIR